MKNAVPRADHATGIIELLSRHQPAFQLLSGTPELSSSEAYFVDGGRETDAFKRASYASGEDVLKFLADTVQSDWVTIETGGGRSTCVFAATAKVHYCINPDITANDLIRAFVTEHACLKADLNFVAASSDEAFAALPKALRVDLAYIDGNHSFPIPLLDWHYVDLRLRKDGLLLVDDMQIRSVALLTDYLATEESYELHLSLGNTSVWRKVRESRTWGWSAQRINHKNTPGVGAARDRGSFGKRIRRRIRRLLG